MKIVTDLLSRWGAAMGKISGDQLRSISQLDMYPMIVPTIDLQLPIAVGNLNLTAGIAFRDSFVSCLFGTQAQNTLTSTPVIANVSPGHWRFFFSHYLCATFVFPAGSNFQVLMQSPLLGNAPILAALTSGVANVPQSITFSQDLVLDVGSGPGGAFWSFSHLRPATGAAQAFDFFTTIIGHRLF